LPFSKISSPVLNRAFNLAVRNGHKDIVKRLIETGGVLDISFKNALTTICANGKMELFDDINKNGKKYEGTFKR
jgi:ankyrin repeat protein